MRLPWGRRHRDDAMSDLRDGGVREVPRLGGIGDEDAGNVTLSGPGRPFSGRDRGADNALSTFGPPWGAQSRQRVRHRWTTREEAWSSRRLRDGVGLPSRIRVPPVRDPWLPRDGRSTGPLRSPRPGRLGHGHSLPGPWTRRPVPFPGASLRGHIPSGRRPAGPRPFRASASRGRVPSPLGRRLRQPRLSRRGIRGTPASAARADYHQTVESRFSISSRGFV